MLERVLLDWEALRSELGLDADSMQTTYADLPAVERLISQVKTYESR